MSGASDQTVFDMIRKSKAYQQIDYRDKAKVELALNNKPSNRPSSWIGQAAWELAKRDTVGPNPPPKPPDPPPVPKHKYAAPQTYNKGSRAQDAQYCTAGLPRRTDGVPYEPDFPGITYNDGLCNGGRTGNPVAGLKPSDEMDNRGPCDPYTNNDVTYPPWPDDSYAW